MKKSSLLLIMCFWATLLSGQTLNADIKSSPVGKLIYGPYPKDIEKVSTLWDLWGKGDNPNLKNLILLDYYLSWPKQVTLNVRIIKLNDGRVIIITHSSNRPNSFRIMIKYLDEDRFDSSKVLECHVDPRGLVVGLSTRYEIDPNGKEGIVLYDGKQPTEVSETWDVDEVVMSDDPTVQRYQRNLDEFFLRTKTGN